jgi:predicted transcriptional regulator
VTTSGPRPLRVALLSFRQPFAEALLDGRKRHEFRRGPAGFAPGDLLLVYETAPVSRVTGVARVGRVHRGSGRDLAGIEEHPDLSDITADYLGDASDAVALQLEAVHRLPEPVSLAALGLDRPPRSYRWLTEDTPLPAGIRDGLAALRRPG